LSKKAKRLLGLIMIATEYSSGNSLLLNTTSLINFFSLDGLGCFALVQLAGGRR